MLDGEQTLEREKRMMESGQFEPYDFTEVHRIAKADEQGNSESQEPLSSAKPEDGPMAEGLEQQQSA